MACVKERISEKISQVITQPPGCVQILGVSAMMSVLDVRCGGEGCGQSRRW